MGKGGRTKNKSKRSNIPRGIPQKRSQNVKGSSSSIIKSSTLISPFEYARSTNSTSRVKHHVHNKQVSGTSAKNNHQHQSALAKSIARRKHMLKSQLMEQHKSNEFVDRRIGEAGGGNNNNNKEDYDGSMRKQQKENAMLKRIVAERVRRSKRAGKFSLEDEEDNDGGGFGLTHRVSVCRLLVEFDTMYMHVVLLTRVQGSNFVYTSLKPLIIPCYATSTI